MLEKIEIEPLVNAWNYFYKLNENIKNSCIFSGDEENKTSLIT